MEINKTTADGKTVFSLNGRLDTLAAPSLQAQLLPAFEEATQVELDFTSLVYVSSAGLRVLLQAYKMAKSKNAEFCLSHVSPEIMTVLEMTDFTAFLNIV